MRIDILVAASLAEDGSGVGCFSRHDRVLSAPDDGKIHLSYWEKWERFEGEAMKTVVKAFNDSQSEIVVHYTPIGAIDRKARVAIAGGDPPDVCGLWEGNLATFASHRLAEPLDDLMAADGLSRDRYVDVFADICTYNKQMYALPTTPYTTALHWNKALFRAAGLDPNKPPRTVEELDAFNKQLTKVDGDGNITQMGYLPFEKVHSWFLWAFPYWWGGTLMADGKITANHPNNVKCYEWIASYSKKYGVSAIQQFGSGFGSFASPQNPFFNGRLAMVVQGVWLHNYIRQYCPSMQWAPAPWPKTPTGPENFSSAGNDILILPVGLSGERREAAWKFMRFVARQESMETLCSGQKKPTPLKKVSEAFVRNHEHPYIQLFMDLAKSDAVVRPLGIGIWNQYQHEMNAAVQSVILLKSTPKETLDNVQKRMERAWQRYLESKARRGEEVII